MDKLSSSFNQPTYLHQNMKIARICQHVWTRYIKYGIW